MFFYLLKLPEFSAHANHARVPEFLQGKEARKLLLSNEENTKKVEKTNKKPKQYKTSKRKKEKKHVIK